MDLSKIANLIKSGEIKIIIEIEPESKELLWDLATVLGGIFGYDITRPEKKEIEE